MGAAIKPRRVLRLVEGSPKTPAGFLAEDSRVDHPLVAWMLQTADVASHIWRECAVIRLFLPDCTNGADAPDANRNLACVMMRDFSRTQTEAYLRLLQSATWTLIVQQRGDKVDHLVRMTNTARDGGWAEDRVFYRGGAGQDIARRAFALRQSDGCLVGALYQPTVTMLKFSRQPTPKFGMSVTARLLDSGVSGVEKFPSGTLVTYTVLLRELYPLWSMLLPR